MGFTSPLLGLLSHVGGWRGHPLEFLFSTPVPLNLRVCLESHFQPIHAMPSTSPPARLLSLQTSQDVLDLDVHDVYLLISLCSKNGVRRNCVGFSRKRRSWQHRIFCLTIEMHTNMWGKGGNWMFPRVPPHMLVTYYGEMWVYQRVAASSASADYK